MFAFGNKFGSRSKPKPERIKSESAATLHGTQEALDLASKAYETKHTELRAALSQLEELDRSIGERNADGIDATSEILERQSVQGRVMQLQNAVAVLLQRKQTAEMSLRTATLARAEAVTAEARAHITALSPRGEALLAELKQYCTEMAAALNTLRLVGGTEYSYSATEIQMQFGLFLGLSKHPLTNNGHVPSPLMKYPTWTDCLEKNCG